MRLVVGMEPVVGESVEVGESTGAGTPEFIESDVVESREWYNQPKHLWLLSFAGKPVYSRHGDESMLSSKMGMLAGIIGVVNDTKDSLQFFVAGACKFVFLVRGPIYLVMASRTLEPVLLLRAQLDYICEFCSATSFAAPAATTAAAVAADISTCTPDAHLIFSATSRIIELLNKSSSTDIRNFLAEGHEDVLERLQVSLDSQLHYMLMGYICLPMAGQMREAVTREVQKVQPDNALYAVIFSENLIVTYVEKKGLTLDVDDLLLLVNWANVKLDSCKPRTDLTVDENAIQETVCLPNLDTRANAYAYAARLFPRLSVVFVCTTDQFDHLQEKRKQLITRLEGADLAEPLVRAANYTPVLAATPPATSGARAQTRGVAAATVTVDTSMPRPATTSPSTREPSANDSPPADDSDTADWMEPASSLFSPIQTFRPWGYDEQLWHCVFKSTPMQQIIAAGCEERFPSRAEKVRLFQWQQHVYSRLLDLKIAAEASENVHGSKAAGAGTGAGPPRDAGAASRASRAKRTGMIEYWHVNSSAALLGWSTKNWELIAVFSPLVSEAQALDIAQFLIKTWVPREKEKLFLLCDNGW